MFTPGYKKLKVLYSSTLKFKTIYSANCYNYLDSLFLEVDDPNYRVVVYSSSVNN